MPPGAKRAVPAAQTLRQPGLGGSRLPARVAGPWQLHGGLGGRVAPGVPPSAGISTHVHPKGRRCLGLRVESGQGVRVPTLRTASRALPSRPSSPPS